jgi:cell shape-determining protein MreC
VVLMIDVDKVKNQWPIAKVTSVNEDDQGLVRSATVRTASGSTLDRWSYWSKHRKKSRRRPGEFPDGEPRSLRFNRQTNSGKGQSS